MQLLTSWQHASGMWLFLLIKWWTAIFCDCSVWRKKKKGITWKNWRWKRRKRSSCCQHLDVRGASHTSVNQRVLWECFLSWHFGFSSLLFIVYLCIHRQSWSGLHVLKAWGGSAPRLGHTCKVCHFSQVIFSGSSPSNWKKEHCKMLKFIPDTGDKCYCFILWVFLSFPFHFLKMYFLQKEGCWYMKPVLLLKFRELNNIFRKSDTISWQPKIRIILFPGVYPCLPPKKRTWT